MCYLRKSLVAESLELEHRMRDKKKKKGKIDDGSEDRSFKIADITFAYNNS
jgi:hypothetical protein